MRAVIFYGYLASTFYIDVGSPMACCKFIKKYRFISQISLYSCLLKKSKPRKHVVGMMGTMENVTTNRFSSQTRNISFCFNTHPLELLYIWSCKTIFGGTWSSLEDCEEYNYEIPLLNLSIFPLLRWCNHEKSCDLLSIRWRLTSYEQLFFEGIYYCASLSNEDLFFLYRSRNILNHEDLDD